MGGKSSAPASPDYRAIVEQQGKENRNTAQFNHELGKTGSSGPFGSSWWSGNTQHTALSPEEQQNYWQQSMLGNQAFGAAPGALQRATQGINMNGAPGLVGNINGSIGDGARQQAIDSVYNSYAAKLDPMFKRQNTDLETSLINKGFDPNSEAYREQVANASRNQNEAYQQALNAAVTQGNETQNQQFMQALQGAGFQNSARQQALDEILKQKSSAWGDVQNIMGMNQVNYPQGASGTQGNAQPADYMGAAQNSYQAALNQTNQQNANSAGTWGTIGNLGALASMFYFMSDERLKDNFEEVGRTTEGVPVWEYDIDGRRERGVVAQQVAKMKPDAVAQHPSGFLMVDYSKVGKF